MGALTNIEYQVDSVSKTFVEKMRAFARAGEHLDLAHWLQCYTFDSIGALTASVVSNVTKDLQLTDS